MTQKDHFRPLHSSSVLDLGGIVTDEHKRSDCPSRLQELDPGCLLLCHYAVITRQSATLRRTPPSTMERHRERTLTFLTIGLIFALSGVEYGRSPRSCRSTCAWMRFSPLTRLPPFAASVRARSRDPAHHLEVPAGPGGPAVLPGSGPVRLQPQRAAHRPALRVLVGPEQSHQVHHPLLQPVRDCR